MRFQWPLSMAITISRVLLKSSWLMEENIALEKKECWKLVFGLQLKSFKHMSAFTLKCLPQTLMQHIAAFRFHISTLHRRVLQPLDWRCVQCAILHERDVRVEQHPYVYGANKQ